MRHLVEEQPAQPVVVGHLAEVRVDDQQLVAERVVLSEHHPREQPDECAALPREQLRLGPLDVDVAQQLGHRPDVATDPPVAVDDQQLGLRERRQARLALDLGARFVDDADDR
jgi:hypothetical protein